MTRKVPLVVYTPDGRRKIVGSAEVSDDMQDVVAIIDDPEIAEKLQPDLSHLSIGEDPKPTRRNVFDQDKD